MKKWLSIFLTIIIIGFSVSLQAQEAEEGSSSSSTTSSTSSEPTTTKDQLGLTLEPTHISGDAGGTAGNQTFASYENINHLTIVEPQLFGVDVDGNYWAIRGGTDARLSVGSGGNVPLNLKLSLGWQQLDAQNAQVPQPQEYLGIILND